MREGRRCAEENGERGAKRRPQEGNEKAPVEKCF